MEAGFVCILNEDYTKVLAVNRRNSDLVGFPGGKYEPTDKDIEATAIREAKEETGIDFTNYLYTQIYTLDGIVTFYGVMQEQHVLNGSQGIEPDIATIWLPIDEFIARSEFKEYNSEVFKTPTIINRTSIRMSKCQTYLQYFDMQFMASDNGNPLGNDCNGCYFRQATSISQCNYAAYASLTCSSLQRKDRLSIIWLRIA